MAVTEPDDTIDRAQLAGGISWLLAGIALLVLDVRLAFVGVDADGLAQLDLLFDPVGAAVVLVGIRRIVTATPRTTAAGLVRLAAWLNLGLVTATEVGIITGELAVGGAGVADAADASLAWQVLATVTVAATAIGVVLLARHLRQALTGVAADRWRQVTIAWAVTLAVLPLVLLTGALELVFVVLAAVAIAGVLLLVALFATRRAAEENELDRRFEG